MEKKFDYLVISAKRLVTISVEDYFAQKSSNYFYYSGSGSSIGLPESGYSSKYWKSVVLVNSGTQGG